MAVEFKSSMSKNELLEIAAEHGIEADDSSGGEGTFLEKRSPLPSPTTPSSLPPKTFNWWGGRAAGVPVVWMKRDGGEGRRACG